MSNIDPAILSCMQFASMIALISIVGAVANEIMQARKDRRHE